ncbi:MAG: SUMF1/EgtB/PvdO family nonheme iron enzyme [Bacteroidota bacterium]
MLYPSYPPAGKNYLFIVSIDDYKYQTKLNNAVADAMLFKSTLLERFQFKDSDVLELLNQKASKQNIFEQFKKYKSICTPKDSLVVYYSGHGYFDKEFNEGYWIPHDVKHPADFISNNFFTSTAIPAINTLHTIFIVDSCYSGTMFGNIRGGYEALQSKPSKWLFASGRNEVVPDGPKGQHSPFAQCLVDFLNTCQEPTPFSKIITEVSDKIAATQKQSPQSLIPMPIGGRLQNSGDKGGEFVFFPVSNAQNQAAPDELKQTIEAPKAPKISSSRAKLQLPKDKFVPGGNFYKRTDSSSTPKKTRLDDFFLSEHPITNKQFAIFLNHHGNTNINGMPIYGESGTIAGIEKSSGIYSAKPKMGNHPVNYVSWIGANLYIDWLNSKTGYSYRLPTETEWEYAASDGSMGFRENGRPKSNWLSLDMEDINEFSWNKTNSNGKPHPVKRRKIQPNLGIFDLNGNVWEWCLDQYDASGPIPSVNPNLKAGLQYLRNTTYPNIQSMHVLKGGSFLDDPSYLRLSYRTCAHAKDVFKSIGFRLARSL